MTATRPLLALLAAVSLAGPALAQTTTGADEAVATAARKIEAEDAAKAVAAAPPVASPRAMTTQEQIAAFLAASPAVQLDEGPGGVTRAVEPDGERQVHGSAGVSVGTGGYRSAYVSTQIPIGETATLGIAVSQTDFGKTMAFHPYDADLGYVPRRNWSADGLAYGVPGYWSRGGKHQSIAVSLAVGERGGPPEGCASAFQVDGRYVEPLWATQMRGAESPCGAANGR